MSQQLVLGGVVGPVFFVVLFLIEGATRRGYDALRQPVSTLALGHGGWMQRISFVLTGALTLGFSSSLLAESIGPSGLRWVAALLVLYSVGLVGAGVFVTDPIGGYPPGTEMPSQPSVTGSLHGLFSLLVFLPLFFACIVAAAAYASAESFGLAVYSAGSGVAFGTGFVLFGRAMSSSGDLGRVAGLVQRTTITIGWVWIVVFALHVLWTAGV